MSERREMKKINKACSIVLLLTILLALGRENVYAGSRSATVSGYLGPQDIYCYINNNSNTYYADVSASIQSDHRVEKLCIDSINIVMVQNGGVAGDCVTGTDTFSISYAKSIGGTFSSASARFSIESYNFGDFTCMLDTTSSN